MTLYKKILYICKKNDMKSYKAAENVYVHDRCYVVHYEHVEANIIDGYEETPEYNDIIRIERNGVDITRRLSEKARLMFDDEINK